MKIRLYVFIIILIVLLWQLILIILTVVDLLNGIELRSVNDQLNESTRRIPRLIHQMWKNEDLSTYPINNSHLEWKKSFPNYQIKLWTDREIEKLILKAEYKYLYSIYKSYIYSIQRSDLSRLIILHFYGGIYADLDVYPYQTNIENLILRNTSFIIGRSSTDLCLVNHFILSEKHSHILTFILHQIHQKTILKQIYILPYLEVFSTGSIFLTNIIRQRLSLLNPKDNQIMILSRDELSNCIFHDAGRSWHLIDGFLINQIDAHPKLFFIFPFILFISCFLIKFNKVFKRKYAFR